MSDSAATAEGQVESRTEHQSAEYQSTKAADSCDRQVSEVIGVESAIPGVVEPTIGRYFETLNAGDFQATAHLFAETGELHPPFDDAIVGPDAIAAYLEAEAKGMKLLPREGSSRLTESGVTEVKVTGKVQTPLFGVNVSWYFLLNEQDEILSVGVKLLAALEELLHLKR